MIAPQLQSVFVFVRDLDRALFFYSGMLGLPIRRRWADGAEVGGGDVALTLALADADTGPEWIGRPTGITFAVDQAMYRSLVERGIFRALPVHYPWGTLAMLTDPDGNEFALLAPAATPMKQDRVPSTVTPIRPSSRSHQGGKAS